LHPLILCAPFIHRSFAKPLGYAGDYMMVRLMLEDPYVGNSTFARLINALAVQSATAQAHRNRIDELLSHLETEALRVVQQGRRFRVLNVGCGPAEEVQRFLRKSALSDQTDIRLIDFNEETLQFARDRLDEAMKTHRRSGTLETLHQSVHDLLKQAASTRIPQTAEFDLVYCAGLFDYLGDRICSRLVKLFIQWVLPEGLVLCTNVHARQPERAQMEHLQEWHLILRDETQMLGLAPPGYCSDVHTEALGVNVFLKVRRSTSTSAVQTSS
jgi:extracellular factor (EF) 3-hydroxypalmitic acid methyl ester biosynthesis protein